MASILHSYYGPTEGPLGFPMTDKQAFALEAILKALPKDDAFRYRKAVIARGPTELLGGERTDVSWISTEDPDRTGDVVLARGMNDSQFRLNPIVTLNHAYWAPPVGRSLWRKVATDGPVRGIKAKTQYPARPADWPADKDWPADIAFALVGADLLRGKSVGLLPTKVHTLDVKEIAANPGWEKVGLVIDEWVLLEYACVFLPAQQNAVLESVGKSLPAIPELFQKALDLPPVTKGPIPYEETAKADKDRAWDADAAVRRLRQWAGVDDTPEQIEAWEKFRRGFAYCTGDGTRLGDYHLPHHDIIDGKLCVVFRGVQAALAAVNGARGGVQFEKDSHRKKVYGHLARHYGQFDETPPDLKEFDPAAPVPFTALATIEASVRAALERVNPLALAERIVQQRIDQLRGHI